MVFKFEKINLCFPFQFDQLFDAGSENVNVSFKQYFFTLSLLTINYLKPQVNVYYII